MARGPAPAVDLLVAAHGGPSVVVTVVVAGLGIAADVPSARLVLLLVAVLAGQLAIGWVNDVVDAERDRVGGRSDKPVAAGRLSREAVVGAAVVALAVTVVASLLVGAVAGGLHLVAVGAGLAHDVGVKATPASPLPWALAFGLLPAFTVAARGDGAVPTWWAVVAGAGFGVGVHLANALPDLAVDRATGVRGLAQRLGRRWSLALALVVLVGACTVVLVGGGATGLALVVPAVVTTLVVAGVVVAARLGADETAYRLVLVLGLVTIAMLVAQGTTIVA